MTDVQTPGAIDWIEVGRASHRLGERFGRDAWRQAEHEADAATSAGDAGQAVFWRAVNAACRPRGGSD
jgi:hypothetical protein